MCLPRYDRLKIKMTETLFGNLEQIAIERLKEFEKVALPWPFGHEIRRQPNDVL